jgi:two-component system sensor histidine kinase/response regulator
MNIFEGKTVISIEDKQIGSDVLEQTLNQLGIIVQIILDSSDIEAEIDASGSADVIFLDLETSNMNSYAVLEHIQQSSKFANIPVVAYTTHTSHLSDAKHAGFHSFLAKPLDEANFPNQLSRILAGESVWEGDDRDELAS